MAGTLTRDAFLPRLSGVKQRISVPWLFFWLGHLLFLFTLPGYPEFLEFKDIWHSKISALKLVHRVQKESRDGRDRRKRHATNKQHNCLSLIFFGKVKYHSIRNKCLFFQYYNRLKFPGLWFELSEGTDGKKLPSHTPLGQQHSHGHPGTAAVGTLVQLSDPHL